MRAGIIVAMAVLWSLFVSVSSFGGEPCEDCNACASDPAFVVMDRRSEEQLARARDYRKAMRRRRAILLRRVALYQKKPIERY